MILKNSIKKDSEHHSFHLVTISPRPFWKIQYKKNLYWIFQKFLPIFFASIYCILIIINPECQENEVDSTNESNDTKVEKEEPTNWKLYTIIICGIVAFVLGYYYFSSPPVDPNSHANNAIDWFPPHPDANHRPVWFEGIDLSMSREQEHLLTREQRNYCINKMIKYVNIRREEYWEREQNHLDQNPLSKILYDQTDSENDKDE